MIMCVFFQHYIFSPHAYVITKVFAAAAAKLLQPCLTLYDPIDGSPPGSPVRRILQARTLEWVAISLSNAWKWKVKEKSLSHVRLLATPWTAAYQAPPSMGFSRQEYWSGVPLPSPTKVFSKILNNKCMNDWKYSFNSTHHANAVHMSRKETWSLFTGAYNFKNYMKL